MAHKKRKKLRYRYNGPPKKRKRGRKDNYEDDYSIVEILWTPFSGSAIKLVLKKFAGIWRRTRTFDTNEVRKTYAKRIPEKD